MPKSRPKPVAPSAPEVDDGQVSNQFKEIFNGAQHLHKHQKLLSKTLELINQIPQDVYYQHLMVNMKFSLHAERQSPFTKHLIDFMAKLMLAISKTQNKTDGDTSDQENRKPEERPADESQDEIGLETLGSESFCHDESMAETPTLTDTLLKELCIPYLYNLNADARFNTLVLLRKLLTSLQDVNEEIFYRLKKSLVERLPDKEKAVRAEAALTLHWFQEPNNKQDVVVEAFRFHLKNDPNPDVRRSCLKALQPCRNTFEDFIYATRDVNDLNRKLVYLTFAEKIAWKKLSIEQRLKMVQNGLNERSEAVKRTFVTKVLPSWIKSNAGDLVEFLGGLDIQSDVELISKLLKTYFKHSLDEETNKNFVTTFHLIAEKFAKDFLNDNRMTKKELTVELVFLWRNLAEFCKEHDVVIVTEKARSLDEETAMEVEEDGERDQEQQDLLDQIVPDLPFFCKFLKTFVQNISEGNFDEEELIEFEFMYNELMKLCLLYELGDEIQRNILFGLLNDILKNLELSTKFSYHIFPAMKCMAKLIFKDFVSLFNFVAEFISDITTCLEERVSKPEQVCVASAEQINECEMQYARLTVKIHSLNDDLDAAKAQSDFLLAAKINEEIKELMNQRTEVGNRRMAMSTISEQPSQPANQANAVQLNDYPKELLRCLHLLSGCLEFGDLKDVNAVIRTHIEQICLNCGILSEEPSVRQVAVKTLGIACMFNIPLAKQFFGLLVQILNNDVELVQIAAIKSIFDILCSHGISFLEERTKNIEQDKSRMSNDKVVETTNEQPDEVMAGEENDLESEVNSNLINKSRVAEEEENLFGDEKEPEKQQDDEEEEEDDVTSLLTNLFINHLNSESDEIKQITAQGIGNLLILGRIYSPELLSRLVVLWYDPDSGNKLRQFLGVFLPIYSGVSPRPGFSGQQAFEDCFITLVESVYKEHSDFINLDHLINFLLELIVDDGHRRLAFSLASRILTLTLASELSSRFLLRALSLLQFNEMDEQQLKDLRILVKKIEKMASKNTTKSCIKHIDVVKSKITKQMNILKMNSSQASLIEDFGQTNDSSQ